MTRGLLTRAAVLGAGLALCPAGATPAAPAPPEDPRIVDAVWQWLEENQNGRAVRLDPEALKRVLALAPLDSPGAIEAAPELTLPLPDGTLLRFRVVESPILAAEVAERFPEVRTYSGQGVDDPGVVMRLTWTGDALQALMLARDADIIVTGRTPEDPTSYETRSGGSASNRRPAIECSTESAGAESEPSERTGPLGLLGQALGPSGSTLRTFRLALAATGEYTNLFRQPGDTDAQAQSRALAKLVQMTNAVSAIYERDLAIRLQLVTGTQAIYTDPLKDPYTNGDTDKMRVENQTTLDDVKILGSANYDIGHVFGTNSGGQAFPVGQVCTAGDKAKGVTGRADPAFLYDIYLVAHETGHQFSASHTFNGTAGLSPTKPDCGPARVWNAAYEPGSGSTLMSYAGGCNDPNNNQNMQPNRDDYFHAKSRDEVLAYVNAGNGTCAVQTATGNNEPTVGAPPTHTIPRQTPFVLTASGSDPDGDPLTFGWEEYDLGQPSPPDTDADGQERPILRSYPPTADPSRLFPSLRFILDNANVPPTYSSDPIGLCSASLQCLVGEALPTISRTMTFRATVRDNRPGGGGAAFAETQVHVDANSGPFAVTAPNTPVVWTTGFPQTVAWDVAGSDAPPIGASQVQISLSTDAGLTFPIVLAPSTPNDGAETVVVPNASTDTARIKVEAVGNIFFDISDSDVTLNAPPQLTCSNMSQGTDPGQCTAVVAYNVVVSDDQPGVSVSCAPPSGSTLGKGLNPVQCVATDVHGATDTCNFSVTINDVEGPTIAGVAATPSVLWPPNHKMRPVTIDYLATDNCDPSLVCTLSVVSDEPVSGPGYGNTSPDWIVVDAHNVLLRSERAGSGDGRTYTVTIECTDGSVNPSHAAVQVTVPHSSP